MVEFKILATAYIIRGSLVAYPEEGIIGIKFFFKHQRYAIASEFLILDNIKLPLHEDGEFIPGKTTKVFRIATT